MITNLELFEISKCLQILNFYVKMKDELEQIKEIKFSLSVIVNLNDSDKNINGHWCDIFIDDKQKIFFCSYGSPIPNEVKEFMMKIDSRLILTSDIQLQDFDYTDCGYWCILLLYLLNKEMLFEDIILSFKSNEIR